MAAAAKGGERRRAKAAPKVKPPLVLWDKRGRVACEEHAPFRGSDTWRWDGWCRMPAKDVADWRVFLQSRGVPEEPCETCRAAIERATKAEVQSGGDADSEDRRKQ